MEGRPEILMYEQMHPAGTGLLGEKCDLIYAESLEEAKIIEQAGPVDGIVIRANGTVTRTIMESLPN